MYSIVLHTDRSRYETCAISCLADKVFERESRKGYCEAWIRFLALLEIVDASPSIYLSAPLTPQLIQIVIDARHVIFHVWQTRLSKLSPGTAQWRSIAIVAGCARY